MRWGPAVEVQHGIAARSRACRVARPASVGRGLRTRLASAGFTFIEIVVVIVIVGIFFSFAVPNFDGLTPKYRLRTAARQIGSKVESHRINALSKSVWLGIRYYFPDGERPSYYELLQPPPLDYPSEPLEERKAYPREELPTGVEIESVVVRGSNEEITSGSVMVVFSPMGTSGSHMVTLRNDRDMRWTMKFNAITGAVDFVNAEAARFDDFED